MRASEIRELSSEELERKAVDLAEELFRLKLKKATSQLESPMGPKQVKRDLARVKTILRERQAQGK